MCEAELDRQVREARLGIRNTFVFDHTPRTESVVELIVAGLDGAPQVLKRVKSLRRLPLIVMKIHTHTSMNRPKTFAMIKEGQSTHLPTVLPFVLFILQPIENGISQKSLQLLPSWKDKRDFQSPPKDL